MVVVNLLWFNKIKNYSKMKLNIDIYMYLYIYIGKTTKNQIQKIKKQNNNQIKTNSFFISFLGISGIPFIYNTF